MLARTIARPRATVARSTPPSAPQTTAAPAAAAPPAPAGPTVFFRGTAYSEAEWAAAVASGATAASAVTDDVVAVAAPSLTELMAFAGPAPEAINGRLCMLGAFAALAAEIKTDVPILKQFSAEPTLVVLTAIIIAAGSLVPLVANTDVVPPFPWATKDVETKVGRVAMLGLVAWAALEAVKGSAVF